MRPESRRNVAITASEFAAFCTAFGRTFCAGTVSDVTVHVTSHSAKSFADVRTGLSTSTATSTGALIVVSDEPGRHRIDVGKWHYQVSAPFCPLWETNWRNPPS